MMYISLIDLLPEISHFKSTKKMKIINIFVVIVAIFSVIGIGMLMPHSHGAGTGPENFYQAEKSQAHGHKSHDHHDHGPQSGACCGPHDVNVVFQARRTLWLSHATLNVLRTQKQVLEKDSGLTGQDLHDKETELNDDMREFLDNYLLGKDTSKLSKRLKLDLQTPFEEAMITAKSDVALKALEGEDDHHHVHGPGCSHNHPPAQAHGHDHSNQKGHVHADGSVCNHAHARDSGHKHDHCDHKTEHQHAAQNHCG